MLPTFVMLTSTNKWKLQWGWFSGGDQLVLQRIISIIFWCSEEEVTYTKCLLMNMAEREKKKKNLGDTSACRVFKATSSDFILFLLSVAKCKHSVEFWIQRTIRFFVCVRFKYCWPLFRGRATLFCSPHLSPLVLILDTQQHSCHCYSNTYSEVSGGLTARYIFRAVQKTSRRQTQRGCD